MKLFQQTIAERSSFIAEFLCAVDSRINDWLDDCNRSPKDLQAIDSNAIQFYDIITDLKRRRFHFSPLPPQIFSINHESGADAHQYDDSGNRSSKRVKLDKGTIDNVNRRPEWKLKDGENYAKVFGLPDDVCHRPDGVCLRWHIKGYCFGNCKHHHGEPTEAQASQITKFIKKMRARISNVIGESTA